MKSIIKGPLPIAPLITFRLLFGALMMVGTLRFMYQGWVERLYGEPVFFFKYYGFEWVTVLDETGMYIIYGLITISAAMIMLGLFYRVATILFFLTFTYTELTDATNYLNHYYLICLLAFLLIFLPAHRRFSLDVLRLPALRITHVPAWTIHILIVQLSLVYFCAGYAKLNIDWLFRAMPLAVWLPARIDLPIAGYFFQYGWVAYLFSWSGAIYDLCIPLFLLNRRTRSFAYLAVIIFHGLTYLLFNIGLFPFIMIFNTLIFFPAAFHEKLLGRIGYQPDEQAAKKVFKYPMFFSKPLAMVMGVYLLLQFILPFRYLLYPGNVLWTEEGYRFAWRVMLVEKAGQATFTIYDSVSGRSSEIDNRDYLTAFQEKQMSIQPDFILQFAHFLADEYQRKYQISNPVIRVDSHVALNGRSSQLLIAPDVNLATQKDGLIPKGWILPLK